VKVGIPTEIKSDEYRVALTPAGTRELTEHGHEVIVQAGAGDGSVIPDAEYEAQGARIAADAEAVFAEADLVLKVKEPQEPEVALLREGQLLFTYLHLAPAPELTQALCDSGATCIAYETVEDRDGRLPLLAPMSEVAGKIATQAGAFMLERRGCRGDERRVHRDRDGSRRLRVRHQHRSPSRPRRLLRRARIDRVLEHPRRRGDAAEGRPRDRRGFDPRRARAARNPP
jgi:hypothetical protein